MKNPSTPLRARVLVFGTFDGLHEGHRSFLKQAGQFGDVTVVVGRDSTVEKTKGKLPKFSEADRLKAIEDSELVKEARLGNEAPPGEKLNPYKVIEEVMPDIICLGYDQTHFVEKLEVKLQEMGMGNVMVKRLEAFESEKYHSSILNK
ncbi:adenylyltransferase/cytidyltransferase family protein [Candidatus Parcubacteria bacterium]|nr:adenylyltransferase/cytidyltransferase family protein [Candidatus Parcubacteria bacterium]